MGMRVLVVADEYPWPARSGYRQRLAWIVRTLAGHATVDFLAVVLNEQAGAEQPPAEVRLSRQAVVVAPVRPDRRAHFLWRWLTGRMPRDVLRRDWTGARAVLASWADAGYDAVWFSHAPVYIALRDLVAVPAIVDLDNLESSLLRYRRRSIMWAGTTSVRRQLRAAVRGCADALDERRWRRTERDIAQSVSAVVVCSQVDRDRLGHPAVWVVPNGYERSPGLPDRSDSGSPIFVMVGLLTYEPNRDAARYFAQNVLPRIQRTYPDARFRVVGRYGSEADVIDLRNEPGVEITGEVADVSGELAQARVAVVPVRFGGGTRIKILEAFAHRVAVVTTTVGCEGLDVESGTHLLIADDPSAFASACLRLVADGETRARLTTAAAELWERRYRWTVITPAVVDVLRDVTRDE